MTTSALAIKRVLTPIVFMPNYQVTKQVYALYRSKLRIASKMGYKIGSGTDERFMDSTMFDKDRIDVYARKLMVGDMTWSHIHHTYKNTIQNIKKDYPFDEEIQNIQGTKDFQATNLEITKINTKIDKKQQNMAMANLFRLFLQGP